MTCLDCGGAMTRGRRYERAGTVDVLVCWSCGLESPQLYRRTADVRNGHADAIDAACTTCGTPIFTRRLRPRRYCSTRCWPLTGRAAAQAALRRAS